MMIFESYQPSKVKSISHPSDGLKSQRNQSSDASILNVLLEFSVDDSFLALPPAETTTTATTAVTAPHLLQSEADVKSGGAKRRRLSTSLQPSKSLRKVIPLDELVTRYPLALYHGLLLESTLDLSALSFMDRVEEINACRMWKVSQQMISPTASANRIDENDLCWTVGQQQEDHPLKLQLSQWMECFYHSMDKLLREELSDFYVLGSSALEEDNNSSSNALEGSFHPVCVFHKSTSSPPYAVLINASHHTFKQLSMLGAKCYRLSDSDDLSRQTSSSLSARGLLQQLRSSYHFYVEGNESVNIVAHHIVEEVFSFIPKHRPCRFIPTLLSSRPILFGEPCWPRYNAMSCSQSRSCQGKEENPLVMPLVSSILRNNGNLWEDGPIAKDTVARLSSSIQRIRMPALVSHAQLYLILQQIIASEFNSKKRTALRGYGPVMSLSRSVTKPAHFDPKPPKNEAIPSSSSNTSMTARNNAADSSKFLNPMVIVTASAAARVKEKNIAAPVEPAPVDQEETTDSDDSYIKIRCLPLPIKVYRLLFAASSIPPMLEKRASGDGDDVEEERLYEVFRELKWSLSTPSVVEIVVDQLLLPPPHLMIPPELQPVLDGLDA
eukprot:scaffold1036_cov169-Ochromonas_danica.AAC.4